MAAALLLRLCLCLAPAIVFGLARAGCSRAVRPAKGLSSPSWRNHRRLPEPSDNNSLPPAAIKRRPASETAR